MTTAKKIQERMAQTDHKPKSRSILTIVTDDHSVHCMTEDLIDAWWASLSPVEKADLYEQHLDAEGTYSMRPAIAKAALECFVSLGVLNMAERVAASIRALNDQAVSVSQRGA